MAQTMPASGLSRAAGPCPCPPVHLNGSLIVKDEPDGPHGFQPRNHPDYCGKRHLGSGLHRIPESPGRDRRKHHRREVTAFGKAGRVHVAGGQELVGRLIGAIDRPQAVDDVRVRQAMPTRDGGLAGFNRR